MKNSLLEINELNGVWGSLLCNNQAEIISSVPPANLNKAALENITRHCVEILSTSSVSGQGFKEIVIHFQQRRIFILDLEQAILIVLCTPSIDISLLRMTINVITSRWQTDSKIQKQFKDNYVERL
jgi:predicted regulator of Ras-like GTPase activity (Roadblock/LC7/MglB family)